MRKTKMREIRSGDKEEVKKYKEDEDKGGLG